MRNTILITVLVFFITILSYSQSSISDFNSGDVFLIGNANHNNYKHINFPKTNFIIKKGGIANYKNIIGEEVVLTSIKEKNNGKLVATIKLVGPRKFFNSHTYVTVDIDEAIKNKELLTVED